MRASDTEPHNKEEVSREMDHVDVLAADIENGPQYGVVSGSDVDGSSSPGEGGVEHRSSSNSGAAALGCLSQSLTFFRGFWSYSVSDIDEPARS